MNQELIQYKKYRLAELRNIYNNNCISITKYYNNIMNSILKTSALNKTQQINSTKNVLASNINKLTVKYNSDCLGIKNFNPIQIKINKNKKALLIGINYTGTKNELFGCINDVNAVKERITNQGFTSVNTITDLTTKNQLEIIF